MSTTTTLEEMESRIHARTFAAVMDTTTGPAVRQVLDQMLAVLDATPLAA